MSGGMRQRVAVAQALIMKPRILLLDEPFGALDEAMREELQRMLLRLSAENRACHDRGEPAPHTVFIVTHELNEAIYVGDRVIGLSQYWNWAETGCKTCPGASIVYDKPAPVFNPDDRRDFGPFVDQREEIRRVVFDPECRQPRDEHCRYWDEPDPATTGETAR
jgi:NitT/TauT family transport system ATP-binding protein